MVAARQPVSGDLGSERLQAGLPAMRELRGRGLVSENWPAFALRATARQALMASGQAGFLGEPALAQARSAKAGGLDEADDSWSGNDHGDPGAELSVERAETDPQTGSTENARAGHRARDRQRHDRDRDFPRRSPENRGPHRRTGEEDLLQRDALPSRRGELPGPDRRSPVPRHVARGVLGARSRQWEPD